MGNPSVDDFFGAIEIPRPPRQSGGGGASPVRRARPSGTGSGGAGGRIHNALLTHQAMVKIVPKGMAKTRSQLSSQLSYITRNGDINLRSSTGAVSHGDNVDLRDVVNDWHDDWQSMDPRTTFFSYHVILSYPEGTDHQAAKVAAEDFAEQLTGGEYGDVYKYVIAHHRDTKNHHAHLVINRRGVEGRTLHLSKYGVDSAALRDLHVKTGQEVGISLNATSRFSRGIEQAPKALGRIHAEKDGRVITRPERSAKDGESHRRFPFHGGDRRTPPALSVLERARARNIALYARQSALLKRLPNTALPFAEKSRPLAPYAVPLLRAAQRLAENQQLVRGKNMADNTTLEPSPTAVNGALAEINADLGKFLETADRTIRNMPENEQRIEAEARFSQMLQRFEPVMTEEVKRKYHIEYGSDDYRNADPAAQREEAEIAIKTGALPAVSDKDRESVFEKNRMAEAADRLALADKAVAARFEEAGLSGKLALNRIENGQGVDKATKEKWIERDVQTYANAKSVSAEQARLTIKAAYKDAAAIYSEAKNDILAINRNYAEQRLELGREAQKPEADLKQDKALAGVIGTVVEIGEANYKKGDDSSKSPYVIIENQGEQKRLWGAGLPHVLDQHKITVGDRARFRSPGSETVTVKEKDVKTGEIIEKSAQRRAWEITDIERGQVSMNKAVESPTKEQDRNQSEPDRNRNEPRGR